VPVLPCLVRQQSAGEFGLVTNGDQPWIAKKVKERERHLDETIKAIPDDLPQDSETFRLLAKSFYTDLRETWERAVEEILFNAVVERFGTDVKTQSLRAVEVTNEDYRIIFHAMKGASEYSGHDRAAGRQLDPPSKEQMRKDLLELIGFRATRQKRRLGLEEDRKKLEGAPAAKTA
jgi:cytochrome c556